MIEDACQAHGAEYFSRKHNRWMKAGSMGRAAAFSFYPGKEPGSVRRSRGGDHQRCRRSPTRSDDARPRPSQEVLPRRGRLQRSAGRDPGRASAREAGSSGKVERAAAGTRSRIQPPVAGADEAVIPPYRALLVARCVSPVCDPHRRSRRPDGPSEEGGHRHGNSLSDSAALAESLRFAELPAWETSRSQKKLLRKSFPCRCSRSSQQSSRLGWWRRFLALPPIPANTPSREVHRWQRPTVPHRHPCRNSLHSSRQGTAKNEDLSHWRGLCGSHHRGLLGANWPRRLLR